MARKIPFTLGLFSLLMATATSAQTSAPPQINLALTDLSQRLGQTITLDSLDTWQYIQGIYPSTSLGCELVLNPTPMPNGMSGYSFDLVLDGQTYNYRVATDNSLVIPCTASLLPAAVPTATAGVPVANTLVPAVSTIAPIGQRTDVGDLPELAGFLGNTFSTFNYQQGALLPAADIYAITNPYYGALAAKWSPDGSRLVFLSPRSNMENPVLDLFSVNADGSGAVMLTEQLFFGLPFDISADGQFVYYAKPGGDVPGLDPEEVVVTFSIFRVPITGGTSEFVAASVYGPPGCGGGSSFPGDTLVNSESDYGANRTFFELTDFGLIYTSNCTGTGLSKIDLATGEFSIINLSFGRAVLSDDGSRVATIMVAPDGSDPVLTIVDLATLNVMPLGAVGVPDQLAWGPDGDIFYSTHEPTGRLVAGSDSDAFDTIIGAIGGIQEREVTIHRVNLTAATDTEIYRTVAYRIGRMDVSPTGDAVFFSTIPNGEAWVNAINSGIEITQDNVLDYFPVTLTRLELATSGAAVLAPDLEQFTLNDAAFE